MLRAGRVAIPTRRLRLSLMIAALLAATTLSVATAATIRVTTVVDELDAIPNGTCSLREAVKTVNGGWALGYGGCSVEGPDALGTNDTIIVPIGTYTLTRHPPFGLIWSIGYEGGPLFIGRPLRIVGAGAGATIIDGGGGGGVLGERMLIMDILTTSVRLENLTLQNGRGALKVERSSLTLTDVEVRNNRAVEGGGLHIWSSNVLVRRSTIADNEATGRGGGIFNEGRLTIIDSTISGNRSVQGTGGGIHSDAAGYDMRFDASPTLIVINSTVSGNTALGAGGGIWHRGPMRLDSATITANSSGLHQTRLRPDQDEELTLDREGAQIVNTLLAGNAGNADCIRTLTSYAYNLVGNVDGCRVRFPSPSDQFGTAAAPVSPLLGPLLSNGGATQTHALLPGSPAIDRGAFSLDAACRSTDQRGAPRPTDGIGNAIVRCDVGAYEAPTVPTTADLRVTLTQTPNSVFPHGAMTTTIAIVNHGPARALATTYALTLPNGSPLPATLPAGCEVAGPRAYRCGIGDIPIGGTRTITTIVQAPPVVGNATTGVRVESERDDPLGGNTASATTRVVAPPDDIHVTVLASEDPVGTLSLFTYRVVVQNRSTTTTATNVSARHVLSPGTTAIACFPYPCDIFPTEVLVGPHPPIGPGESITHNVNVIAPAAAGTITNTVTLTSTPFAPSTGSTSGTVLPPAADLGIDLVASAEAVAPGATFQYALSATNLGPSRTDATFTLVIPEGAAFGALVGTKDCSQSDDLTLTCAFYDQLWPGSGALARVDVTAPTQAGTATATATIAGPLPDGQPNNDSASVSVMVGQAPDLASRADVMLALVAPDLVLPGGHITYSVNVTNLGPAEAEDVVVEIDLPVGVAVQAASSGCASPDGTLVCYLYQLPFGDDHTFEVTVLAPDALGPVTSTARVTTATDDPVAANDAASVVTEVVAELPTPAEFAVLVEAGPRTLGAVTVDAGAAPVPALQASLRTEATPLDLLGVHLGVERSAGSSGGTLRVYRDVDADAVVGPDDVLLATRTFDAAEVDLLIELDAPLALSAGADGVVLVTLEGAPGTSPLAAPLTSPLAAPLAAAGLLALVGLRRPRLRWLAAALLLALTLPSCRTTPPAPIDTTTATLRVHLVGAAFDTEGARLVGAPVLGPTITVRE